MNREGNKNSVSKEKMWAEKIPGVKATKSKTFAA
jgi:hypothetical protein